LTATVCRPPVATDVHTPKTLMVAIARTLASMVLLATTRYVFPPPVGGAVYGIVDVGGKGGSAGGSA
jgi:hypothetical protein